MTLEGNFWLIVPHNPLETSINSCKEAKNYLVILDLDENMKFKFFCNFRTRRSKTESSSLANLATVWVPEFGLMVPLSEVSV